MEKIGKHHEKNYWESLDTYCFWAGRDKGHIQRTAFSKISGKLIRNPNTSETQR